MNIIVLNPTRAPARIARKGGIWARVWTALNVYRERRELAYLDDHMLRDIGVTREEALFESRRSLLDLPADR